MCLYVHAHYNEVETTWLGHLKVIVKKKALAS